LLFLLQKEYIGHEKENSCTKNMIFSLKTRQYLLYIFLSCLVLVLTPWWYVKTNEEYVLYRRADNYYASRDFEKAARFYGLARQKGLADPELLKRLGDSYLAIQDFASALEIFRNLQSIKPEDLSVLVKLAHVYSLNGMNGKALDIIGQALQKRPDWRTARIWKARILAQNGQFSEAIKLYYQILGEYNEKS